MAMVMGIIMAMVMTTVEIKRDAMKKGNNDLSHIS
jgi:hypothetical protein